MIEVCSEVGCVVSGPRDPNPYRRTIEVFDEHGNPLVTRAEALELSLGQYPSRAIGWELLQLMPEPAGRVGSTLLWRRADVMPPQEALF